MSDRTPMTHDDIERVANELRQCLQDRTCCPWHAIQVCMTVLAGFALDDAENDLSKAASNIRAVLRSFAAEIERGRFAMVRRQ